MDIHTIASNAVEVLARRLVSGPDGAEDPGGSTAAAQVEAMLRRTAQAWNHIGPLLQRVEEQPEDPARKAVLAAALAEVAGQNAGLSDALQAATEAAAAEASQDDPEISDSSITDSGDRSATITTGRDLSMRRSIFALGSVNNSRRTRINTGIGAMALVLLLGGGVATYQAVKPETSKQNADPASIVADGGGGSAPSSSPPDRNLAGATSDPSPTKENILGSWRCSYSELWESSAARYECRDWRSADFRPDDSFTLYFGDRNREMFGGYTVSPKLGAQPTRNNKKLNTAILRGLSEGDAVLAGNTFWFENDELLIAGSEGGATVVYHFTRGGN